MCCYLHQSSVAKFSLEEIVSVLVDTYCHLLHWIQILMRMRVISDQQIKMLITGLIT